MELMATCSQPHLGLPLRRTIRGDALRKQDPEQDPPHSITQCSPFVRVAVEFVWRDGGSKGPCSASTPKKVESGNVLVGHWNADPGGRGCERISVRASSVRRAGGMSNSVPRKGPGSEAAAISRERPAHKGKIRPKSPLPRSARSGSPAAPVRCADIRVVVIDDVRPDDAM